VSIASACYNARFMKEAQRLYRKRSGSTRQSTVMPVHAFQVDARIESGHEDERISVCVTALGEHFN
jgi:hypothetical protein